MNIILIAQILVSTATKGDGCVKYKRRKTRVSKYISESENKNNRKRIPRPVWLILFAPLILSLASSYIIPNFSGFSNALNVIDAVSKDVKDYLSDKMSFMSQLGKKGAEFCFDYIRKEEKDGIKYYYAV